MSDKHEDLPGQRIFAMNALNIAMEESFSELEAPGLVEPRDIQKGCQLAQKIVQHIMELRGYTLDQKYALKIFKQVVADHVHHCQLLATAEHARNYLDALDDEDGDTIYHFMTRDQVAAWKREHGYPGNTLVNDTFTTEITPGAAPDNAAERLENE